MQTDKNIALIGMPAAGKSTIGVLLAKRIGYGFIDTDILIQQNEKKTLPQIIERIGVAGFIELEESCISSIHQTGLVIATGGSAVYGTKAMKHLSNNSTMVYLDIGLDILKKRLSSLDERGVIRAPGQGLDALYAERRPLYKKWADITIDCQELLPNQVLASLLAMLGV